MVFGRETPSTCGLGGFPTKDHHSCDLLARESHSGGFIIIPANTSVALRHSAIFSAISLWETIPQTVSSTFSRNGFKYRLRNHIRGNRCPTPTTKLSLLDRKNEVVLNKTRCDLIFRSHMYSHNFPFILDPLCKCGYRSQTTRHVLLNCPLLNIQRTTLFNTINSHNQISRIFNRAVRQSDRCQLLLYGDPELSSQCNEILLHSTSKFIVSSLLEFTPP